MRAAVFLAAIAVSATAWAGDFEEGRKMYALIEAGDEYCPEIKIAFGTRSAINDVFGYPPPGEIAEIRLLNAEKQQVFDQFRAAGSRQAVCDHLMREYGPGSSSQVFAFR